jgi:hypothetical protein
MKGYIINLILAAKSKMDGKDLKPRTGKL